MTLRSVFSRACFFALVFLGAFLPGCRHTTEWYGLNEENETVIDSLFYLNASPGASGVSVHISLANPVMNALRVPRFHRDSVDGAAWSAMLQQHKHNVERFYRDQCRLQVQFYGDSVWLNRRFPEENVTYNGDAWFTFTDAQFKQKSEEYDSIRVVVLIDTTAPAAGDDIPYRREYILKPYSRTRWDMSLRAH